jgi:hypothetical protein
MSKSTLIYVLLAGLSLTGCGGEQKPVQTSPNSTASQVSGDVPTPVVPEAKPAEQPAAEHFYSLKEGNEYGYEHAISDDEQNKGQAAARLTMFKFAGVQDGRYQVYTKNKSVIQVIECDKECKFIKVMTFVNGNHMQTERIAGGNGSIASSVMQDAINGRLERAVTTSKTDGSRKYVWFSEDNGISYTPVPN